MQLAGDADAPGTDHRRSLGGTRRRRFSPFWSTPSATSSRSASWTGVKLTPSAYLFSNHPANTQPWNPDWASHRVADLADAVGVLLNIKALRHYTASQLLAAGFDLGNTAARLGHSGGGATTLKHYADPVSEVDRRAAAYLAQLTIVPVGEQPTPA